MAPQYHNRGGGSNITKLEKAIMFVIGFALGILVLSHLGYFMR